MKKMKTIQYIKAFCVIALLGTFSRVSAQEETTNYLNREMTLEREYDPSVQDANKVNTLPVVKEPVVRKIPIDYATFTLPVTPDKEYSLLPSGRVMADMDYNKRRGYLNFAGGTYLNLNGDLGYHILSTEKDQLGLYFSHRSSNGKAKYVQDIELNKDIKAKLNDNLGGLKYRHVFDGAVMSLGASFNHTTFNYYGLPFIIPTVSGFLVSDNETKQANQAIRINAGVASKPGASTIGYRVAVDYTNFSQKYALTKDIDGLTEHTIHGLVDINAAIATSQLVGVVADMNYFTISSPLENTLGTVYENRLVGTVTPYYRIEGSNWNLQLGANVMFVTGEFDKIFFSPNIAANVVVADKTSLYLRADGEVNDNSAYKMMQTNRYASYYSGLPTSRTKLNAVAGIKSGAAPGFWFDIFGGYQITDDYLFFVPEMGGFVSAPLTLDAKRFLLGASLKYTYQNFFELRLKGVYNSWKTESDENWANFLDLEAYGMPDFDLNLGMTVRPIDKLALDLDYTLMTGRYIAPGWNDEKMKNLNELNATVSYTINDTFGAYVKLNNMLFQKYELLYGYPMQGFNAMVGFNLNF